MAKYGPKAQALVAREMKEMKAGKLRSGGSGKKVSNPKQAIAIALSEARREGAKMPPPPVGSAPANKAATKKPTTKKVAAKKTATRKAASVQAAANGAAGAPKAPSAKQNITAKRGKERSTTKKTAAKS